MGKDEGKFWDGAGDVDERSRKLCGVNGCISGCKGWGSKCDCCGWNRCASEGCASERDCCAGGGVGVGGTVRNWEAGENNG